MRNEGRRVSKTQLFNAVYGVFDSAVDESIVESHISKLRRKLRELIGYDPIDSKRFLGYLFKLKAFAEVSGSREARAQVATVAREQSFDEMRTEAAAVLA